MLLSPQGLKLAVSSQWLSSCKGENLFKSFAVGDKQGLQMKNSPSLQPRIYSLTCAHAPWHARSIPIISSLLCMPLRVADDPAWNSAFQHFPWKLEWQKWTGVSWVLDYFGPSDWPYLVSSYPVWGLGETLCFKERNPVHVSKVLQNFCKCEKIDAFLCSPITSYSPWPPSLSWHKETVNGMSLLALCVTTQKRNLAIVLRHYDGVTLETDARPMRS